MLFYFDFPLLLPHVIGNQHEPYIAEACPAEPKNDTTSRLEAQPSGYG